MATRGKPVDVVIVGFGWTGAIMAIELAKAGLSVLALERGADQDTVPDWAYPKVLDEVAQSARNGLLQNLSKTTVTLRHDKADLALPYRQIGSFKPGTYAPGTPVWVPPGSPGPAASFGTSSTVPNPNTWRTSDQIVTIYRNL